MIRKTRPSLFTVSFLLPILLSIVSAQTALAESYVDRYSQLTTKEVGYRDLTIVTEEWAPYNFYQNGKLKGFSVEVVQAIMEELNVKIDIELLPGARSLLLLNKADNVMNFSLFRTKERENKYKWVGPLSDEAIYFYKTKGSSLNIETLEDAKNVNAIAAPYNGLIYDALIKEGFYNLDRSAHYVSLVQKLLLGRVDLAIGVTPIGISHYLKEINMPTDALIETPVKILAFPLYIACSKEIPDRVIKQWNTALDKIRASGKLKKIYDKYR